jgi:alpha-D-ribose 1-methylphosphonate 5-triphosphate synthase subunit PhnG
MNLPDACAHPLGSNSRASNPKGPNRPDEIRGDRLALLACSDPKILAELLMPWAETERTWLRRPETGLVMVQGRMGGTGTRFNLGEISATRCTIRLNACGSTGVGWVSGRHAKHAESIALTDALLQSPSHREEVRAKVIEPLITIRQTELEQAAALAASTRVEFFTMTRGE